MQTTDANGSVGGIQRPAAGTLPIGPVQEPVVVEVRPLSLGHPFAEALVPVAPASVLRFPVSGSPRLDGVLVAGGTLRVEYDAHRLFDAHPHTIRSTPVGDVGLVRVCVKLNDDPERVTMRLRGARIGQVGGGPVWLTDTFTLPEDAGHLTLWFSCGGSEHDQAFDSNGGADYRFDVAPIEVPPATLLFAHEGEPLLEGELARGCDLDLHYDARRLLDAYPECVRETELGRMAELHLGVKLDDDEGRIAELTFHVMLDGSPGAPLPLHHLLTVPRDAGRLAVWFSAVTPEGTRVYDSNGGRDYVFEVA